MAVQCSWVLFFFDLAAEPTQILHLPIVIRSPSLSDRLIQILLEVVHVLDPY